MISTPRPCILVTLSEEVIAFYSFYLFQKWHLSNRFSIDRIQNTRLWYRWTISSLFTQSYCFEISQTQQHTTWANTSLHLLLLKGSMWTRRKAFDECLRWKLCTKVTVFPTRDTSMVLMIMITTGPDNFQYKKIGNATGTFTRTICFRDKTVDCVLLSRFHFAGSVN